MSDDPEQNGLEVTPAEAQRVLATGRAERIKRVEDGLQHLLQVNNCTLDVQMTFSMLDQPRARVVIVPRD
jgi:hypothetical protein